MKTRVSKGGNRLYDLDGDGSIVLYTRNDVRKLVYQARLKPHGTNKVWRISTGRDKFRDAESLARRQYTVLREAVANDTVHSKKFSQILDLYLNSHKFESKPPNCRSTYALKGYIFEFFAPLEISKICEEEIRRFATWRTKNYSKRTPCDATIKREIFYLK